MTAPCAPTREWLDAHNTRRGLPVEPVTPTTPDWLVQFRAEHARRGELTTIRTVEEYWTACDEGRGSDPDALAWRMHDAGPAISKVRPDCPPEAFANLGRGYDGVPGPWLAVGSKPSPWHSLGALRSRPPAGWLFGGIVPRGRIVLLVGRGGSLKSFTWIDLAVCLVTGRSWHGHELDFLGHGRVMALVGEGVDAMPARFDAAISHHGIRHDELHRTGTNPRTGLPTFERTGEVVGGLSMVQDGNLLLRDGVVDLYGGGPAFTELLERTDAFTPDLLVIDTLALASGRAEQNSATEMSVITDRLRELKAAAGEHCTILVVAHTGKSGNDTRGSSAIEDNADAVLLCERDDGQLRITVTKQKDGPDGQVITLRPVTVGDSLALSDPPVGGPVLWSSSSLDNRVTAVLRRQWEALGAHTRGQIEEGLAGDDHDPVSKATLNRMLSTMVESGRLLVSITGQTRRYAPNLDWSPPTIPPLIEDDTTEETA